ncbi:VOC family protein, partial [Streptomyces sioyaensis]|uniref:VOC family protein n=1 Tax=Streptomyces sioyaensis TaxID=67364 RepID=UPI003713D886
GGGGGAGGGGGGRARPPPPPPPPRPAPPPPPPPPPPGRSRLTGAAGAAVASLRTVVLRVDDLDAYCAQLTARGAALAHGPAPLTDRMRVAYLKDPEGNLVELQQWLVLRAAD